ncbi:MAG: hypothetical protein OHK0037_36000 [Elainellaceae cyanobacterium]
MKGLAILLVVISHLYGQTLEAGQDLVKLPDLGSIGVAVFLVLSGFGICQSVQHKGIQDFFFKRTVRIYVPVVLGVSIKIVLDFLSGRTEKGLISSFASIFFNLPKVHSHLWYILFIFFWYCVVYFMVRLGIQDRLKLLLMGLISAAILLVPDLSPSWKVNAFSFPLGYCLGLHAEWFLNTLNRWLKAPLYWLFGAIALCFALSNFFKSCEIAFSEPGMFGTFLAIACFCLIAAFLLVRQGSVSHHLSMKKVSLGLICLAMTPYLGWVFREPIAGEENVGKWVFANLTRLLFAAGLMLLITLFVRFNRYSIGLKFLGDISYEVYILHGIFMVHYDFILFRGPLEVTFFVYLAFVCILSLWLNRLSGSVSNWIFTRCRETFSSRKLSA